MSELVSRTIQREGGSLQWDIYSQIASDTEVHLRENKIESIRSPIHSQGYAIRVVRARERGADGVETSGVGIAPGNILQSEQDVTRTLEFAIQASKMTSAPSYHLPSERRTLPMARLSDQRIVSDQSDAAKDLAQEVISLLGKEKDIRITFCKIRLTKIDTKLVNCFGLELEKSETFAYFEAGLSPKSKELAEYWPHILTRRIKDLELSENVPRWARFARDSPRAMTPETGKYYLIAPPHILSEMAPPIAAFHASASSHMKGMSRWKEKGQKVWSDKVTITDDGTVDFGLATSPFDDEGTPQQKTDLVVKGDFKNYLANNMYAKFASTNSTGNAMKVSRPEGVLCYNDDVGLARTNTVMEGGDSDYEEMIKDTKRGLLIEQFSWMLPDPMTGTFGAEIRHGYFVENGEIKNAVKGGVVNGSFFDSDGEIGAFNSLDLVSRERKNVNASVMPYVRFPSIRVSGK